MLEYPYRVRDIVHGLICLTEPELKIIDLPIFQRLRFISQNDLDSRVYPSLNSSRFEHSLGTAFVAGKMAESVLLNFTRYKGGKSLKSKYFRKAGFKRDEDFVQTVRVYGLLHDVGHLPWSHLFESAFKSYTGENTKAEDVSQEWFGFRFKALHEACGAALVEPILAKSGLEKSVEGKVKELMTTPVMKRTNALFPIKELLASEIDSDRIDGTARDGLLAGGEYGNFDIERLCSSVSIIKDEGGWSLGFSHKAINSLESLLFERYRTYNWVHLHHKVQAIKAAACLLLDEMFEVGGEEGISKDDFNVSDLTAMSFRDDVWLWHKIRNYKPGTEITEIAKNCLVTRCKDRTDLLWKHRADYLRWLEKAFAIAKPIGNEAEKEKFRESMKKCTESPKYEPELNKEFGGATDSFCAKVQKIAFTPVYPFRDKEVKIINEKGEILGDISEQSNLVLNLNNIWRLEPQFYVIIFGEPPNGKSRSDLEDICCKFTVGLAKESSKSS